MVAIVNYNMGNLASVKNAFNKIGAICKVVDDPDDIKEYDRVLLPGVGAFGDAMKHLKKSGMDEAIIEFADSGKPILGICLGMQILFTKSFEFGENSGLGLIPGEVVPFNANLFESPYKIPHMGWNKFFIQSDAPLFSGLTKEFYLYFVHSYHAVTSKEYILGATWYGYEFVSAVRKENIFGLQPHPEKSHDNGLEILKNFVEM